jgi:hypothetical protein
MGQTSVSAATEAGNLEVLKWLCGLPAGERCPWDYTEIIRHATVIGAHDVLNWMKSISVEERRLGTRKK